MASFARVRSVAAAIAVAADHDDVWATVGLHPHDAVQGVDTIVDLLDQPGWRHPFTVSAHFKDGAHRIVRIETPGRNYSWTAEARSVHHTSHTPHKS